MFAYSDPIKGKTTWISTAFDMYQEKNQQLDYITINMSHTTVRFNCTRLSDGMDAIVYLAVIDVCSILPRHAGWSLRRGEKNGWEREGESDMCIVYSNSCSYLFFISKSRSRSPLCFALKRRSVITRSNHRITTNRRRRQNINYEDVCLSRFALLNVLQWLSRCVRWCNRWSMLLFSCIMRMTSSW